MSLCHEVSLPVILFECSISAQITADFIETRCCQWAYQSGMLSVGLPVGDVVSGPTSRGCCQSAYQSGMLSVGLPVGDVVSRPTSRKNRLTFVRIIFAE